MSLDAHKSTQRSIHPENIYWINMNYLISNYSVKTEKIYENDKNLKILHHFCEYAFTQC